jgi:hypothetical protein
LRCCCRCPSLEAAPRDHRQALDGPQKEVADSAGSLYQIPALRRAQHPYTPQLATKSAGSREPLGKSGVPARPEDRLWSGRLHPYREFDEAAPRQDQDAGVGDEFKNDERQAMGRTITGAVVSLDCYIEYRNDVGPLFDWYGKGDVEWKVTENSRGGRA